VAEADRLLERGQTAKADKLYGQALTLRPDGVAALTGTAYVLLDHQRHLRAVETFRRALSLHPTYGPALFGIAESYRARGDGAKALEAYRQYLASSPAGVDAPAARRQIRELEESAAARPSPERAAQTDPAAGQP
jgi:tetratricopeptide (TPR) repeat protein